MIYGNAVMSRKYPGTQSGHTGFMNDISSFDYYPGRKSLSYALDRVPNALFQSDTNPKDSTVVIYATGKLSTDDESAIGKLRDQGYRVVLIGIGNEAIVESFNNPVVGGSGVPDSNLVIINPDPYRGSDIDAIVKNIMKGKNYDKLLCCRFFDSHSYSFLYMVIISDKTEI